MINTEFIGENKKAIWFLTVFTALYFALNTCYGLYIQSYYPASDPFTRLVATQVATVLSLFDSSVKAIPSSVSEDIAIINDRETMIYVFEGCNGLNVMIVYLSFLVAFKGPLKLFYKFFAGGLAGIHLLNLGRVVALYGVRAYFPDQLYFFHKYLFTGIIYVMVFVLWYYWVRLVKQ
ncbi:MAG TPA: exosortase family protein XrtF [Cyclobacteriaceae bacterium]|jgi:exosortase family protein XrtF|nr:exosortase family protein XrtF [Cyclobacteriaceae bacterium]